MELCAWTQLHRLGSPKHHIARYFDISHLLKGCKRLDESEDIKADPLPSIEKEQNQITIEIPAGGCSTEREE